MKIMTCTLFITAMLLYAQAFANTGIPDRLDAKYRPVHTVPACYQWQRMQRLKGADVDRFCPG